MKLAVTFILIILFAPAMPAVADVGTEDSAVDPKPQPEASLASWSQVPRAPSPSARYYSASTFDSNAGLVVLFGGDTGSGRFSDTWTYDSTSGVWTDRAPANPPPATSRHTMVYEPLTKKNVMFGGTSSSSETWIFDANANTWTNSAPTNPPAARLYPRFAALGNGKLIMYGGAIDCCSGYFLETWSFDVINNTWTQLFPSTNPGQRAFQGMAYYPITKRVILFGGRDAAGTLFGDTWAYDAANNSWAQLSPSNPPSGRNQHAFSYDPFTKRMISFAGGGATDEIFLLDIANNSWSNPVPNPRPAARALHESPFDTRSRRLVVFGGCNVSCGTIFSDTWHYDPVANRWQEKTALPSPRSGSPLTQASPGGPIVMFGGAPSTSTNLGDTWSFNPSTLRWTDAAPSASPTARNQHSIAWDPVWKRMVLFGGYDWTNWLGDTWLYDLQNNTWTQVFPSAAPGIRYAHRLVYDPQLRKIVLYGGYGAGTYYEDLWTYDVGTNQWSQIASSTPPGKRLAHGFDYNPDINRIVLFSGASSAGNLGDTWLYDATINSWTQLAPATSPPGRFNHAFTYSPESREMILFGGQTSSSAFLGDTWVLNPSSSEWTLQPPSPAPSVRNAPAQMHGDPATGKVVLFGGWSGSAALDDTWTYAEMVPIPPRVVSTLPADGTSSVGLGSSVAVMFDQAMDPIPTASSFSISPTVGGASPTVSGTTLTWTHSSVFEAQTTYLVTILKSAQSAAGDNLLSDYSFNFATGTAGPRPQVLSTIPGNGDIDVSQKTSISVTFSTPMDPSNTSRAFTVSPDVSGATAVVSGSVMVWTHPKDLLARTLYTANISAAATSSSGISMASAYSFIFVTGGTPAPVDPASIVFTVPQPSFTIGKEVLVRYVVYDANGNAISTKDSWDFSPKDVAEVKYLGQHLFSVTGLKAGDVKITLTAQGDTKSVTNSTSLRVNTPSAPVDTGDFNILGIPLWALLLALLAVAGLLLFFIMMRRSRRRPDAFTSFVGGQQPVRDSVHVTRPPKAAHAGPSPQPAIERDATPGSPASRDAANHVAGAKSNSRRPPPPPPPASPPSPPSAT